MQEHPRSLILCQITAQDHPGYPGSTRVEFVPRCDSNLLFMKMLFSVHLKNKLKSCNTVGELGTILKVDLAKIRLRQPSQARENLNTHNVWTFQLSAWTLSVANLATESWHQFLRLDPPSNLLNQSLFNCANPCLMRELWEF